MHHIVWNVAPAVFTLGPISVRWYGLFFALGFFLGFHIMGQIYRAEQRSLENLYDLFFT
jgi:phosphatidylglycerol---prolipoprotein diacylglyceryl transferase